MQIILYVSSLRMVYQKMLIQWLFMAKIAFRITNWTMLENANFIIKVIGANVIG